MVYAGVHDAISAQVASLRYDGAYLGTAGLSASLHGTLDQGQITWRELAEAAERIAPLLGGGQLIVDLCGSPHEWPTLGRAAARLSRAGVSAIMLRDHRLTDQALPREAELLTSCLDAIDRIRQSASGLPLIVSTSEGKPEALQLRVKAYTDGGADAIMVRGGDVIPELRAARDVVTRPLFMASSGLSAGRGETAVILESMMLQKSYLAMNQDGPVDEGSRMLLERMLSINSLEPGDCPQAPGVTPFSLPSIPYMLDPDSRTQHTRD